MVLNSGSEVKSNALNDARDKRSTTSKTSLKSQKSDNDNTNEKRSKSSPAHETSKLKTNSRIRSKTEDGFGSPEKTRNRIPRLEALRAMKKFDGSYKSETNLEKKTEEKQSYNTSGKTSVVRSDTDAKGSQKIPVLKIPRLTELAKNNSLQSGGAGRERPVLVGKKPSEIPKPKSISKPSSPTGLKPVLGSTRLPVRAGLNKELPAQEKLPGRSGGPNKKKLEFVGMAYKAFKEKKVKDALKDNFDSLTPLYENELQKITQVWANTIYCSLSMRANLVKLLFQIFPNVEKDQFETENQKLLGCFSHTKTHTQLECDNVVNFIKSLAMNRQLAKDQYSELLENEEVAEKHNHEWRKLCHKIAEFGEKAKQLQSEIPELQKRKEANEVLAREKIKHKEHHLAEKDEELQHLVAQLNNLKQKDSYYKGNVLVKVQDYNDIKSDVLSLKAMEKEFHELKAKFLDQNESYEKKIKNLELLLEEKKKILEKEREIKQQLQSFLSTVQTEQKKLSCSVGKDLIQYVLGDSPQSRDRRREKLWIAAVKLVLRGFMIQMKKLERDRNKMLLDLQSNDSENFTTVATSLVKKDYFIKSIRHQMNDIQKACKY